ncbi:hypothetical protein FRC04_011317 [Tulasnella sp. 424]|nr:hypothetical protein FRC04_011317 [Tulasnella sp. 424]
MFKECCKDSLEGRALSWSSPAIFIGPAFLRKKEINKQDSPSGMQSTTLREGQITPVRAVSTVERINGTEALTVPEILLAILDHTAAPTLASAARVSRAWSSVALDKLWFDYDVKVIDLLLVLPLELTMYEEHGDVPIPYWKLRRDPTDEERIRFQSYASRIRSLSMPGGDITDADQPRFDPSIAEWKLKNDALFPRLRRIEWSLPAKLAIPSFQISSFTTSSMQELNLTIPWGGQTTPDVITPTFHDLTTIEGLRLKKFKFKAPGTNLNWEHTIADFIAKQKDTLQTIELLAPCPRGSPLVGQPLRNLTALDIHIPHSDAEVVNAIQALVKDCPRVAYLRIGITAGKFDLSLRAMLGWQLLSFDVWSSEWLCLSRAHIAEMAGAWPKLKKFGFKGRMQMTELTIFFDSLAPRFSRTPLSRLADIISGFSELEELGVEFFYDLNEDSHLPVSSHSSSPIRCGSRLRKLRLGRSSLPKSKEEQDTMGVFIAAACPPGLRIQRSYLKPPPQGRGALTPWVEAERIAVGGRDTDPEWDALFQKIEELHGGVKVWVGSIPEEDDGIKGNEVLMVPEILLAILDHVTPSTLTSAARVSRVWSTVALDRLWSDFDVKVIDLLRILPLESATYEDAASTSRSIPYWRLQRDPTDDEWTRFQLYASRIRSLSMPLGQPLDRFHPSITEWKAENDDIFPRLRRVKWPLSDNLLMPSSQLSSFSTSGLQELSLTIPSCGPTAGEVATSTFDNLTTIKGIRLKKFKLESPSMDPKLGDAISNFVIAQGDSLRTLELLAPCTQIVLPMIGHPLRNLKALDIHIPRDDSGEVVSAIQALVEGCPLVSYLRMGIAGGGFDLDFPGLQATFGWQLLTFDAWTTDRFEIRKAHIAAMANAWPKLKKLGFKCRPPTTYSEFVFHSVYPSVRRIPLSRLADIISGFSELEELGADFFYDLNEGSGLPVSFHSPAPLRRGSCLRKLRLGRSYLPRSEEERDMMGMFMAAVCPPGLHIQHSDLKDLGPQSSIKDKVRWVEVEGIAKAGRDVDYRWDALFRKIEELHGGVKIWVGSIPEEDDGVWF